MDFKPGDMLRAKINPNYHVPNRPHFDVMELKGGGDAVSAARAVLQTGEYDYAWNMQVEDEILLRMETGGKGRVQHHAVRQCRIRVTRLDRSRGRLAHQHRVQASLSAFAQAFDLLIDRASIEKFIYRPRGPRDREAPSTTSHGFRSKNTKFEFNIKKKKPEP